MLRSSLCRSLVLLLLIGAQLLPARLISAQGIVIPGQEQKPGNQQYTADQQAYLVEKAKIYAKIDALKGTNLEAARQLAFKTLEIDRKGFGDKSLQAADTLAILADLSWSANDMKTAVTAKSELANIYRAVFGENDYRALRALFIAIQWDVAASSPEAAKLNAEADALLNQAASLTGAGRPAEALPLAEKAHKILMQLYAKNPDVPMVAIALTSIGSALQEMTRFSEAAKYYDQAIEIFRSCYGDSPDLANVLRYRGDSTTDPVKREQYFRQVVEIYDKLALPTHLTLVRALGGLVESNYVAGRPAQAMEIANRAIQVETERAGAESAEAIRLRILRIRCTADLGQLDEAESELGKLIAFLDARGPEYLRVRIEANNVLALVYLRQEKLDLAEKHYRIALDLVTKQDGEQSYSYTAQLSNLAYTEYLRKQYAAAAATYEKCFALSLKILPPSDPELRSRAGDLSGALRFLAAELNAKGNRAEARKQLQHAVDVALPVIGPDRPESKLLTTALALQDLVDTLPAEQVKVVLDAEALASKANEAYRAGNLAEAELSLRQAIKLQDTLGDKLPRLIRAENLGVLGVYLKLQSKYAESIETLKVARADFEHIFQGQKPSLEYANVICFLGEVSENLKAWGDAAKYYNSAIETYRRLDGDPAKKAAYTLPSLARCYLAVGSYEQALTIHRQHVNEMQRIFGKDSYPYADAVYQLAKAEFGVSNFQLAKDLFNQASDVLKAREPEADKLYEYRQWLVACDIRLGNADAAIAALEQLLVEARETKNPYRIKYAATELGLEYRKQSRYDEAEKLAEEVMAVASKELADDPAAVTAAWESLASVWINKVALLESERNFGESIPLREKLIAKQTEIYGPENPNLAVMRQDLAAAQKIASLPDEQQQKYVEAKKLLYETGRDPAQALAAAELVHQLLGDKSVVVALAYQKAAECIPPHFGNGEPIYEKALAECIAALGADSLMAGELHKDFGKYLNRGKRYQKSVKELKAALAIFEKHLSASDFAIAETKVELADPHTSFGDLGTATRYLNEAESVLAAGQHKFPVFVSYVSAISARANIAGMLGDLRGRLRLNQLALQLVSQRLGDREVTAAVYHGLVGDSQTDLANYEDARRSYNLACEILRERGQENSSQYGNQMHGLANVAMREGNPTEAAQYLQQALELSRVHLGEHSLRYREQLIELSRVQLLTGKPAEAEITGRKALEVNKEHSGTTSLLYRNALQVLAQIFHRQQKFSEAGELLEQSLDAYEQIVSSANNFQTEGEHAGIMQEARRQLGWFMNVTLKEPEQIAAAYDHLLWLKGSIFARQRRLRELRSNPAASELFARWTGVTSSLATLAMRPPYAEDQAIWSQRLALLSADKDAIERELLSLASGKTQPAVTVNQVQKTLPEKSALVDFFNFELIELGTDGKPVNRQYLRAFVVRPDRTTVAQIDIKESSKLNELIDHWRESLEWTKSDAFQEAEAKDDDEAIDELYGKAQVAQREAAAEIKRIIWQPLEKELEGVEQVIISPDGALAKFPLAALPGKQMHTYLIEDLMLSSIAVPSLLPELMVTGASGEKPSILLMGDVNYGGSAGIAAARAPELAGVQRGWLPYSFSPLPGVLPEMQDIAKFFSLAYPEGTKDIFVESEASESVFRQQAPAHRWVHLATHGIYKPTLAEDLDAHRSKAQILPGETSGNAADFAAVLEHEGLKSGLALAGANEINREGEDDGILSAMEVSSMDLTGVELTMLSACQTGLGESLSGEGVAGLQRAFQVAGVRSTVTTLWSVDDTAARLLAARFYRNLWERKMSKAAAMREAQSWMIAAAYRDDGVHEVPEELTIDAEVLPGRFRLPECWAPFVLSGDWR